MAVQQVLVTNTAANAVRTRDQDNPARQPFTQMLGFDPTDPTIPGTFTVPTGKCLVIEFVSGYVNTDAGVTANLVQLLPGGHCLPARLQTQSASGNQYVICQTIRAYVSPGSQVSYSPGAAGGVVKSSQLILSGHLVDVP